MVPIGHSWIDPQSPVRTIPEPGTRAKTLKVVKPHKANLEINAPGQAHTLAHGVTLPGRNVTPTLDMLKQPNLCRC